MEMELNNDQQQQQDQHQDPEQDNQNQIRVSNVETVNSNVISGSNGQNDSMTNSLPSGILGLSENDLIIEESIQITVSQMTDMRESADQPNTLGYSITYADSRAENELQLQRMFQGGQVNQTVIIDIDREAVKEPYEDEKYFMGYFKWFWGQFGFLKAYWKFLGRKAVLYCFWSFCYNIGIATGAFFFKRLVIPKLDLQNFC